MPSWLRQMESAFEAFHRHEERLQALSLRPSDYVHRQCRFTPYPTEDVGWIVEQAGADLVLFSSDYPHVEGGRKPLERFEASLGDAGDEVRRQFYADNFLYLMGSAAAAGGLSRVRPDDVPPRKRRAGRDHLVRGRQDRRGVEGATPPDRYAVLRRAGTEPPWSGDLLHVDGEGVFRCAGCGAELFDTDAKFESGTGWPSFDRACAAGTVLERRERGFPWPAPRSSAPGAAVIWAMSSPTARPTPGSAIASTRSP